MNGTELRSLCDFEILTCIPFAYLSKNLEN